MNRQSILSGSMENLGYVGRHNHPYLIKIITDPAEVTPPSDPWLMRMSSDLQQRCSGGFGGE